MSNSQKTQQPFTKLATIAKNSLNSCLTPDGYTAGCHHFVDLWARDSLFACYSDPSAEATKVTLSTFLTYQRKDGAIPYRVRRSSINLLKYFGRPSFLKKNTADFRSFQSFGFVPDGGLMVIIMFYEYIKGSNDTEFLHENLEKITQALQFYVKKYKRMTVKEWFLCEWADAVMKSGTVLYTNTLYLQAIKSMIDLFSMLNRSATEYQLLYSEVKKDFDGKLYNSKFYSDWNDGIRHDYFTVHPQMLLGIWGLIPSEQAEAIFNQTYERCYTNEGVKSQVPLYPWYVIPFHNFLTGTADYHNGIRWLQPWILFLLLGVKLKKFSFVRSELNKIEKIITEQQVVYENYDQQYQPIKRFFYQAEGPFAWSSGLLIWLIRELKTEERLSR